MIVGDREGMVLVLPLDSPYLHLPSTGITTLIVIVTVNL